MKFCSSKAIVLSCYHMGRPGVAPSGASYKYAPSGASYDNCLGVGSGAIEIEGGLSLLSCSPSETRGALKESSYN